MPDDNQSQSNLTPTHGVLLVMAASGAALFALILIFRPRSGD